MFYFLKEDFEALNTQIEEICEKIKGIGQEMGKSCQEGAETFHDNFAYEDGERQQLMWSGRLRELVRIRNNVRVITPSQQGDSVGLGRTVIIQDEVTGKTQTLKIGSYMVLKKENRNTVSYNAPLARMLISAKEGEIRKGNIANREKTFRILKVW